MAFVGPTTERKISTSLGKTFKIFLTEQEGGYWVATILFAEKGTVSTKNLIGDAKEAAYELAFDWTKVNIDQNASIEALDEHAAVGDA